MRTRASWWWHPAFTAILPSVVGLTAASSYAVTAQRVQRLHTQFVSMGVPDAWPASLLHYLDRPWLSLLVGALAGAATMLLEKRQLRHNIELFADQYRLPAKEWWSRVSWRTILQLLWPRVLGMCMSLAVASALRISLPVAVFAFLIGSFLTYPERLLIYRAAKARLEDSGNIR